MDKQIRESATPIHIAFCVNDGYVPYITVTIKSIAENNRNADIVIHILTDTFSVRTRKRLEAVVGEYDNISLQIHEVDDTPLRGLKTGSYTIYTWYRILLPHILPDDTDRVLYLDADTLVLDGLEALFATDMSDSSVASVVEDRTFDDYHYDRLGYSRDKHYVCCGVLLMNLDYWRKHGLTEKIVSWAQEHNDELVYPDQDAINYICSDTKILLPLRYGIVQWFFTNDKFYDRPWLPQLEECVENPAIVHYAYCVPWYKDVSRHLYFDLWIKYNGMLRHPVRRRYKSKGWLKLKLIVWNLVHSFEKRQYMTAESVRAKIDDIKKNRVL